MRRTLFIIHNYSVLVAFTCCLLAARTFAAVAFPPAKPFDPRPRMAAVQERVGVVRAYCMCSRSKCGNH